MFFEFLTVVHFSAIIIGLILNIIFIKLAVISRYFQNYTRFLLLSMVLSMMTLAVTNGLGLMECLIQGTFIETQQVKSLARRQIWNRMGLIAGFFIEVSQFMVLIERLIGVRFSRLRKSTYFSPIFITLLIILYSFSLIYLKLLYGTETQRNWALIMTNSMVSISLFLSVFLFLYSKYLYSLTTGTVGLNYRFEISDTFEICRGLVPASIYRLINRLLILMFLWMNFIGFNLKLDDILNFFFFINIARSLESVIFPALFISLHRKLHRRFNRIFCRAKKIETSFKKGLNGKRMDLDKSQKEYFDELRLQWRNSAK